MLIARRVSFQEYTFLVASAVEGVHDERTFEGAYPEIQDLSAQMRAIEAVHGLESGQYWRIGDAPIEYQELSAKYDDASEKRFIETLRELEGQAVTSLYQTDRAEYARLRERGRRSFFHKDETVSALADTIVRYEEEARTAASVQAFTAAVTLLGAAVEGLLLLRCLRSKKKATTVAAALPRPKRPRDPLTPSQWSFDTLIHVCLAAGWLPEVSTESTTIRPDGLAHVLRGMRNHVHPGKVCMERPWIEAEGQDFADAEIVYTTLFATLSSGPHLKRLREAAAALLIRHRTESAEKTTDPA